MHSLYNRIMAKTRRSGPPAPAKAVGPCASRRKSSWTQCPFRPAAKWTPTTPRPGWG